jgi:hypothetical protein
MEFSAKEEDLNSKCIEGSKSGKGEEKNSLTHGIQTNFRVLFELSFVMFVSVVETKTGMHVMYFYCIKFISPLRGSAG